MVRQCGCRSECFQKMKAEGSCQSLDYSWTWSDTCQCSQDQNFPTMSSAHGWHMDMVCPERACCRHDVLCRLQCNSILALSES